MENKTTIIFGAGPAGLAAGYELVKNKKSVFIIEKDTQAGGISKTIKHKDYYFDIGGHRFFTKEKEVQAIWDEVLGQDFLKRPRLSRIFYGNKFYFYPLKAFNALQNIGIINAAGIVLSYAGARLRYYMDKNKKPKTFEEWVVSRFGKKLFTIFFKTYTEKVWGIPTSEIGAEWAAQRIKGLSLTKAIINAFFPKKSKVTSLIDEFNYPKYGPGMMYGKMAEQIQDKGGKIKYNTKLIEVKMAGKRVENIVVEDASGIQQTITGQNYISSIPLPELFKKMNPLPPQDIIDAVKFLQFRSFITICLILDTPDVFPDNWIYIHSPEIRAGRIQNFKNWSPYMVPDAAKTSLGMEYFCFEGDELWRDSDKNLIDLGIRELKSIGLGKDIRVLDGFVIRQKDAYPTYKIGYREPLDVLYSYVRTLENLQIVGRGGTFRYNNMDHSILTGLYAAKNIMGEHHDILNINTEEEYHEIKKTG